ncbi:hypothetical protein ACWD4B_24330 [Streptomyces sp. NPDC002536]
MKLTSRMLAAGAVATAAVLTGPAAAFAADAPPSGVEDFQYPQAEKIFQERGIKLKTGDGHIVLATCGSQPGLIEVHARGMQDRDPVGHGTFCFRITGRTGYLSLELPQVYGVVGNDYTVNVNMQTDTETKSFPVDKNKWTGVGEPVDPQRRQFTLLEIVAKK